ncbi:MAG: hypothetical protein ACP5IC_02615 [Minisyncoccia bacterium]
MNITYKNKTAEIIGGIAVLLLAAAIIYGYFNGWWQPGVIPQDKNNISATNSTNNTSLTTRTANPNALPTLGGGTREKIQENIPTPDVNSNVPSNIAKPSNVVTAGGTSLRQFTIQAQGGKYIPSTIVVNEGDVVNISLDAVDADYNIFIPDFGITIIASKGATGRGQFSAFPFGQYKFVCDTNTTKTCPANMSGTLIINKK